MSKIYKVLSVLQYTLPVVIASFYTREEAEEYRDELYKGINDPYEIFMVYEQEIE